MECKLSFFSFFNLVISRFRLTIWNVNDGSTKVTRTVKIVLD
ncbi:hypothetical protein QGW_1043 [Clostridioides difficile 824]|nr:hypothetical protein QGW_1043 [Clostridioides difficile 824]